MECASTQSHRLPVPRQVLWEGPGAPASGSRAGNTKRPFFLDLTPLPSHSLWAALIWEYSEGEGLPRELCHLPPHTHCVHSRHTWWTLVRLGRSHPKNPQSCGRGQFEESGRAQAVLHLREKEEETSQLPQATRKQFARWNSTSNANKIIMTIFMGECGGPSVGFHYRVYKCDCIRAASLLLQAAAVGWCMVIWCKLPPNMVILSSARGVWSHKPGDVGSRCFLTSLQAAGIVERGRQAWRQGWPSLAPVCVHAVWPGKGHFTSLSIHCLTYKIGIRSARIALRIREDTLRTSNTVFLLIIIILGFVWFFFCISKVPFVGVGQSVPRIISQSPGVSSSRQKTRTTLLKWTWKCCGGGLMRTD